MTNYVFQLIIAYTCVGVFVVSAVITLLAITGIIKIPKEYLDKLFVVIVVEIAVICVGFFSGLLKLDPGPVQQQIIQGEMAEQTLTLIETAATTADKSDVRGESDIQLADATDTVLPTRIYVHIAAESQRATAETARLKLQDAGDLVPGIQNVGITDSPPTTQLRYFRTSEASEAEKAAQVLIDAGIPAPAQYIEGYEDANLRPRHFELWFGTP